MSVSKTVYETACKEKENKGKCDTRKRNKWEKAGGLGEGAGALEKGEHGCRNAGRAGWEGGREAAHV